LTQVKAFPPLFDAYASATFIVGSISMMDLVMLAIGFAFFALSIGYVYACDLL
jgi:hypothetical protein